MEVETDSSNSSRGLFLVDLTLSHRGCIEQFRSYLISWMCSIYESVIDRTEVTRSRNNLSSLIHPSKVKVLLNDWGNAHFLFPD